MAFLPSNARKGMYLGALFMQEMLECSIKDIKAAPVGYCLYVHTRGKCFYNQ